MSEDATSSAIKVRNIRLVDSEHYMNYKIHDFGAMALKSEFVKKA